MIAAYELMRLGLKPVIYEAGRHRRPAALAALRGCRGRDRRAGRHALPGLLDRLLPLSRPRRPGRPARSPTRWRPATPSTVIDLDGETDLRRARRRICRRSSTRSPTPGARRWRRAPASAPSRTRSAPATSRALKEIWNPLVPIWDDRSFYDFVATSRAFASRSLPPSRGVRPGRLRHRRLGHRLSQLDAGDPARRRHQLRRGPAPGRRRRRADAAPAVAARAPSGWRIGRPAPRSRSCTTARRGRASPAIARAGDGRFAITDRWGDTREYAAVLVDLPVLAAHHPHRHRRAPVLAPALDGAGPHPLHAVVQDLRHGRPAVLEGAGPAHRPLPDEHDAHRPADPRHLSVRPRPGPAGRDLPVLLLDERCPEDAAAAGRPAGRAGARRA